MSLSNSKQVALGFGGLKLQGGALSLTDKWGGSLLTASLGALAAAPIIGFEGALGLLLLLGMGGAIVGLYYPAIGMLGVGLLTSIDPLTRVYLMEGGVLRWNTLNYLFLAVALLHLPGLLRVRLFSVRIFLAFLGLLGFQLLYTTDFLGGVQHIVGAMAFLGLTVYFIRAGNDPRAWLWLGLLCGSIGALGGLVFQVCSSQLSYINPNAYAFFPVTALAALCLGYHFVRQGSTQVTFEVLALANALWIFLSGSRGGMLMGVTCLLFIFWAGSYWGRRVWAVGASCLLLLLAVTMFSQEQAYARHRVSKLFDSNESMVERTNGRFELARAGWIMFVYNPLGIGTGGFSERYKEVSVAHNLAFKYNKVFPAHSGWIKVLAENGVFGIVLLGLFVSSFGAAGLQSDVRGLKGLGLLVTVILSVGLLSTAFQGKALVFVAAGAVGIFHHARRRNRIRSRTVETYAKAGTKPG